jgi:hypothetical protein
MPAISPRLGEFLVKATRARDIDDAFGKVFSEYLVLKTMKLASISETFKKKWGMDFNEFRLRLEKGTLGANSYGFDTEQDFWEWEEAETLRSHYERLQEQWT